MGRGLGVGALGAGALGPCSRVYSYARTVHSVLYSYVIYVIYVGFVHFFRTPRRVVYTNKPLKLEADESYNLHLHTCLR